MARKDKCEDCKWFAPEIFIPNGSKYDRCPHPKHAKVYGGYAFARRAREVGWLDSFVLSYCGKRARWFEPKEVTDTCYICEARPARKPGGICTRCERDHHDDDREPPIDTGTHGCRDILTGD